MSFIRRLRGIMNRRVPYLMTCRQVDALTVDYVDGALRRGPRRRVRLHLRMCPDCRSFLGSYAATIRAARAAAAGDDAAPDNLEAAVISRLSHGT